MPPSSYRANSLSRPLWVFVLLFGYALLSASAGPLPIPFHQSFSNAPLEAGWQADSSTGNTVSVEDGTLKIEAAINTYAHIQRHLGVDLVRVASTLKPQGGISWVCSLCWRHKAPALLVLGKGFSRDEATQHFTNGDLNNDFSDPGPRSVSLVRDVSVESAPVGEVRLTDLERKVLADAGRDLEGEAELAAKSDPSFASVRRHFPAMKHPREALGVKDGPQEFVVMPDGSLVFSGVKASFMIGAPLARFGEGNCAKRLHEGYLPVVVAAHERDGLKFDETSLGWSPQFSPDTPLSAFVRLRISNPGRQARAVPVQFVVSNQMASWNLTVPGGKERSICAEIPFDKPANCRKIEAREFDRRLAETTAWWKAFLSKGIRIEVPEERVNQAWRAWLAYNFIDVDKRGNIYEPHDGGGGFYEEVYGYSASRYCYALDCMGYPREAQRYLDSILSFVTPDGLLVVNYGLPDTGVQLWAMAQHFRITRDAEWLRRVAPTMIRMCDWVVAARKTSMAQAAKDAPWYGLIKYRPYCDEPDPAYSYHTDTYLALEMAETAAALYGIGMIEAADRIARESTAYHKGILPHLYSGTQQMLLLRNMLLREEGQDLWIGQAIPRPWLENGKEVRVENAPTLFGKVGFVIRCGHRARRITAELDPPKEHPPTRIFLRLRHPENRAIGKVTVNGVAYGDYEGETVTLKGLREHATICVTYK